MKRFIDNVAIEVTEVNFLLILHSIFSPRTVTTMPEELVAHVAGESEESHVLRKQFKRQIEFLKNGAETCKRFVGIRCLGE